MKHEYEAKFLAIDINAIRTTLTALGAKQVFPRTLLTRKIFENDTLARGAWVRLRNEGSRSTLTLKQVTDATTIDGTTEIETTVGDLAAMAEILTHLGAPGGSVPRELPRGMAARRGHLRHRHLA